MRIAPVATSPLTALVNDVVRLVVLNLDNATLRLLAQALAPYLSPPPRSAPVRNVHLIREESDVLIFEADLPPPSAPDVVGFEFSVQVDDHPEQVRPVAFPVSPNSTEFAAPQGAVITLKVREFDDAGNPSDWSDPFTITATDTLPPPKPGQVGVRLLREEADEPAPVADQPPPVADQTAPEIGAPPADSSAGAQDSTT